MKSVLFPSLLVAMRPSQWTKNLVVFAAFFFAFGDRMRTDPLTWQHLLMVGPAALLFCLVSSGVYVLNDIRDLDADRHHPVKRNRPIASGAVSPAQAWRLSIVLLAGSLAAAFLLSRPFTSVLAAYVAIQLVYSFWLKRIALIDIMVIASGFVLRAIAGGVVLPNVSVSPWLLLCTFLLALFLALCKRRHEKLLNTEAGDRHRPTLEQYDRRLLDQLIAVTAAATIVSYSIYTLWPITVEKFGSHALGFTIPFVIFGVFRYLDLAYRHERGDRPEKILLTDVPILVNIGLYGLTLVLIFLLH